MASSTAELREFVRAALEKGQSREATRNALLEAGWPASQVDTALGAFAEVPFAVPVPRPGRLISAREAFIYLTLFTTLYLTAYYLGSLLFALIDIWVPDAAERAGRGEWHERRIRWAIAALIVAAPVYIWLNARLARGMRTDPAVRHSAVREWLTYLTLFGAAVIILVDLIWLIFSFLDGALTLRFGLKLAVVAVIAGGVFGYYLPEPRAPRER